MTQLQLKKDTQNIPFWQLSVAETTNLLQTDIHKGLSEEEAISRLKIFGLNVIEKTERASSWTIFLNQLKSPLILILLVAGAITIAIDHFKDALFIFAAVIVNTALGFYQEFKAEKALEELKTYLKQRARVIRNDAEHEIDAANLVPGDIIRLEQGGRVPADGRLFFVNDFQVDEAVLTGESLPVEKKIEPATASAGLGDQTSMVFAGTLVTQGIGTAMVCRTHFSTEIGKIASLVAQSKKEETPLQIAIKKFSLHLGMILGALTLIIFGVGIMSGYSYVEMFLTSVAIAVSAVPEGLPIAMTVILAIGVQRMARRKGVVRKLVAAEALGSTTLILTDKTGTLTEAKMKLSQIFPYSDLGEQEILESALINTDVLIENPSDEPSEWRVNGRVIEVAIVKSAAGRGVNVNKIKKKAGIINYMPFNAVNKFSASLIEKNEQHELIFFGAPDILIKHSSLSLNEREKILAEIGRLASNGELVVGVATKKIEAKNNFSFSKDLKLSDFSFKGLIALSDPIRPSVKEAIRRVEGAGIKTVIMTGDHKGTAEAVAKQVGMNIEEKNILDAAQLQSLPDEELKKLLPSIRVISRVTPADKMRIVRLFQDLGEIVAMTGDGVNDAPSLKQADVGVAMGSGTEVARDVADLVLLDDNFETIAAAVKEGRQIVNNIRKAIVYLLSNVAGELCLIGGALLTGLALPLSALQILWINFFSDSFPAVAFAFEKDIDGFSQHPRNIKKGIFDPLMKFLILFVGFFTSALLFGLYWLLADKGYPLETVKTFIFASFGSYTLFLAFSVRSLEKNIFNYSPFSNPYIIMGTGIGFLLMAVALYMPFFQNLLGTVALPLPWLIGVILIGLINIAAVEAGKWIFQNKSSRLKINENRR